MKFVFLQCILPSIFSRLFADRIPEAIRPRGARLRSSLVSRFVSQILKRVSILLSILTVDFNDIFFFGSLIFDFFPPFFFRFAVVASRPVRARRAARCGALRAVARIAAAAQLSGADLRSQCRCRAQQDEHGRSLCAR